MPIQTLACCEGHKTERFYWTMREYGVKTEVCEECGHSMSLSISSDRGGLTYFNEDGTWIHNLGHDPVYITSHAQHQRIMRERGLQWVTPQRGMPGAW